MKSLLRIIPVLLATLSFATPTVRLELPKQLQKNVIPNFVARDRNADAPFNLGSLRRSVKPETERVVIAYFATWCKPCREGITSLSKNSQQLEENNIQVILVNVGESDVASVHKWVREYGNSDWLLIMDTRQQLVKPFGLLKPGEQTIVLPLTLILDNKLKPIGLLGTEGDDWPALLWQEENFNP
ncbi:MAG: TlpA family protein disulfide reductase [Fibromonadaceae bacterium]|jgi:thiol-disulfide isomerase/thioredoxin|nr:TlpA family protein disulfide reductase [Fibromonadaceae bacterium]